MRWWLVAVPLLGCSIEVKVKPHAVDRYVDAGTSASSICSGQPFGASDIDFAALAKEAGVDLTQGCLKSAKFDLYMEISSLAGGVSPAGTCDEPQGVVTLQKLTLDFTCANGSTQSLEAACPFPEIDLPDGTISTKLNACLDAFELQQTEPLRRLINTCRPTLARAALQGTCSPNTCFSASFKVVFKLTEAVAVLGGTCP